VTIESTDHTEDAVNRADLLLVTVTTLAKGTNTPVLGKNRSFFTAPPLRAPPT
jgi:hypothetical protein